jgi:hypothetical protein
MRGWTDREDARMVNDIGIKILARESNRQRAFSGLLQQILKVKDVI